MPDPYVGWDVFFYNALFCGPIILIWWIVERVKTAKQNRERRKDSTPTRQK